MEVKKPWYESGIREMLSQVSLSRDVTLGSGRFYLMQLVSCMMHLFTPAYVYILSPSLPSLQPQRRLPW